MRRVCWSLLALAQLVSGAAFIAIPGPSSLPKWVGIEPNQGQTSPDVLALARGQMHAAITTRGVLLGTWNFEIRYVDGKAATTVRLDDPLPGRINVYQGPQDNRWFNNIPRYRSIDVGEIFPGVSVGYRSTDSGELLLTLRFAAGVSTRAAVFEAPHFVSASGDGLIWRFGVTFLSPALHMGPAKAFQDIGSQRMSRKTRWTVVQNTRFRVDVEDADPTKPIEVEAPIPPARYTVPNDQIVHASDTAGNLYWAAAVPDSAAPPAMSTGRTGCGTLLNYPFPCTDVAVYKYSPEGRLLFASFLSGELSEVPRFLGVTSSGALMLAGNTGSTDFPVGARAFQPTFAGPNDRSDYAAGDYFAARLDNTTGTLAAATYLGGPYEDRVGAVALGPGGSLHFLPRRLLSSTGSMPVSPQAFQPRCSGETVCQNSYTAALDPTLERLLYGTYLPEAVQSAQLHTDGTLYFCGTATPSFPATPNAYLPKPDGPIGYVARLDAQGRRLIFGTFVVGWARGLAVAPDGSVWVGTSSSGQILRVSSDGARLLAAQPLNNIVDLAVNQLNTVHAIMEDTVDPSADAPLQFPCIRSGYLRLNDRGERRFATYLADYNVHFDGFSPRGNPLLRGVTNSFEITQDTSTRTFVGCLVDAAALSVTGTVSPGAIVTVFGQQLGPPTGVSYSLEAGRVPTTLAGTVVLVNGEPAPILYSSDRQVNFIVPYSVQAPALVRVTGPAGANSEIRVSVLPASITLFSTGGAPLYPAAALNEDGTLNSPENPARKGSRVVLFGTGVGQTSPPSVAGEITPVEPRPATHESIAVYVNSTLNLAKLEYAGAAPGLVSGVTQLNIRLPETFPDLDGVLQGRARILTQGTTGPFVTIAVK